MVSTCFPASNSHDFAWNSREDFGTDNIIPGGSDWAAAGTRPAGMVCWDKIFFVRSIVFAVVHLICKAVPGHDVRWIMAVPQQHATFEHFEQTGAAEHPALCRHCASHCAHCSRAKLNGKISWVEKKERLG
jgi:hypothetical protein